MRRRMFTLLIVAGLTALMATPLSAQPRLDVVSPTSGETIDGTTVTVEMTVSGFTIVPSDVPLEEAGKRPDLNRPGEGHLHLMLDTLPIVVWYQDAPYTFTNVPPGEHVLTVELAENDHAALSPPVVQQIRFRTVSNQVMPVTGVPPARSAGLLGLALVLGVAFIVSGLVVRRLAR